MNILICSILRNRAQHLKLWNQQINKLVELNPAINFWLSIYTNDNSDSTIETYNSLTWNIPITFQSETLNTNYYGSFKHRDRVANLAAARNKCMTVSFINQADKVVWIEPDVIYDEQRASKLLYLNVDIISGRSVCPETQLYDTWATRKNPGDTDWVGEIPTEGLHQVYSTFNGFCVYNTVPIRRGCVFSAHNNKTNTYDCDTAVICQQFHDAGYTNIQLDAGFIIQH